MPRQPYLATIVALAATTSAVGQSQLREFFTHLEATESVSAEQRAFVADAWTACEDCDEASFLTEALTLISPPFRAGLDAYDAGDMAACVAQMGPLLADPDPYLATHAALYKAKAEVDLNDVVAARQTIDALLADAGKRVARYTYAKAEVDFLRVYCLVQDLQFAQAEVELLAFLDRHPDAPQRLIVSANQMLAELRNRQAGRIGEVTDLMNYAAGRLENKDAGATVQERQAKAIALLDKLIEEAEQQEQNNNQNQNPSGGGGSNNQTPNNPMPDSQLPQGASRSGALRETRRANPGEMWGAMPPAEREQILQALQDTFPRRYRRLVEQYYEQLAKEP